MSSSGRTLLAGLVLLSAGRLVGATTFSEELASLAQIPVADRISRLEELAAAGTPLIDGSEATFLVEARDGRVPTLLADFNGWGRYADATGIAGGQMTRIADTDWFYAQTRIGDDARIEYGYSDGEVEPWTDPNNQRIVSTFGMDRSVLEMPEYAPSPWVPTGPVGLEGRLETFRLQTDEVQGGRPVWVYLPADYPLKAPFPVVYFNDGAYYVGEVGAHRILDKLIGQGIIAPVIGVFVSPLDRSVEYRGQRAFLDFFVNELVPTIDDRYGTLAEPEGRAIIGGSRGALGAAFLAWGRPGIFGQCGMMAPAITPSDLLDRITEETSRPVHFHLVGGRYDVRFIGDFHRAVDTLLLKGYSVRSQFAPIGHTPHSWKHYLPDILRDFFGH